MRPPGPSTPAAAGRAPLAAAPAPAAPAPVTPPAPPGRLGLLPLAAAAPPRETGLLPAGAPLAAGRPAPPGVALPGSPEPPDVRGSRPTCPLSRPVPEAPGVLVAGARPAGDCGAPLGSLGPPRRPPAPGVALAG